MIARIAKLANLGIENYFNSIFKGKNFRSVLNMQFILKLNINPEAVRKETKMR